VGRSVKHGLVIDRDDVDAALIGAPDARILDAVLDEVDVVFGADVLSVLRGMLLAAAELDLVPLLVLFFELLLSLLIDLLELGKLALE